MFDSLVVHGIILLYHVGLLCLLHYMLLQYKLEFKLMIIHICCMTLPALVLHWNKLSLLLIFLWNLCLYVVLLLLLLLFVLLFSGLLFVASNLGLCRYDDVDLIRVRISCMVLTSHVVSFIWTSANHFDACSGFSRLRQITKVPPWLVHVKNLKAAGKLCHGKILYKFQERKDLIGRLGSSGEVTQISGRENYQ